MKWLSPMRNAKRTLQCDPFFEIWDSQSEIRVAGPDIVPGTTYEVGCLTEGHVLIDAIQISTPRWGDITGPRTPTGWSPPDGVASILDIAAVVDSFRGRPDALPQERADLYPADPDQVISIYDLLASVEAFRGLRYPFQPGETCTPPLEGTFDFFEKYTSPIPWYTIFIGPNAWYFDGKTYVVFQGNGDSFDSYILAFDHGTMQWSSTSLIGEGANDHGVPAILVDTVLNPGQIHVFYGSHHYFYHPQKYARSVLPGDTTEFEVMPPTSFASTYPQPMQFADGEICLFFRESWGSSVGQDGIWGFISSSDAGDNWTSFTGLLDNIENEPEHVFSWYGRFFKAPDESIHFAGVAHQEAGLPPDQSWKNVYYMYSEDRGVTWKNERGEWLDLPLSEETADQIRIAQTQSSYPPSVDFDEASNPYLLNVEKDEDGLFALTLRRHNGGQWTTTRLPLDGVRDKEQTGRLFVHDHNNIDVFASGHDGLVQLQTTDGGASWMPVRVIASSHQGHPSPVGVQRCEGAASDFFLIFRKGQELYLWGESGFAQRTFGTTSNGN